MDLGGEGGGEQAKEVDGKKIRIFYENDIVPRRRHGAPVREIMEPPMLKDWGMLGTRPSLGPNFFRLV